MFKNPPRALTHLSAVPYVTKDRLITVDGVFNRECPHKFYPIGEEGEPITDFTCKLHGFSFNREGKGINNKCNLRPMKYMVGTSGIIYENWAEPSRIYFDKIAAYNYQLYETTTGSSKGSWLWNMDMEVDVMHLRQDGIHPWLAANYRMEDLSFDNGEDWVIQIHKDGFWLLIFPFTFIEYSSNGGLCIKTVTPNDIISEWGFTWNTQIYFSGEPRTDFLMLKSVYDEDVRAVEQITKPYRPVASDNYFEHQNVLFGKWVTRNRVIYVD